MHFANPKFLFLFLFIPFYLLFLFFSFKKKKGINVSVFSDLVRAKGQQRIFSKYLKYFEYLFVVGLLFIWPVVLARPQGGHEKEELSKKGIDMIIAIDVSESMLAEDLQPNRLEAAKSSLEKFINNLSSDRLGIIVFSGQAFTQSPLTFDYNILREYINNISIDSINKNVRGLSGTAIGDAVLSAVNRFHGEEKREKVLVVITDGDANTGVDPLIAVKKAKEEGIKVYTVGVGKPGGAPLPMKDMLGRKTYAKNRDGSLFMTTFNENSLKKIASIGDGQYFRASDNNGFDKVMAEINSLEKREIKVNTVTEYSENFYPYLGILALFFVIYLFGLSYKGVE